MKTEGDMDDSITLTLSLAAAHRLLWLAPEVPEAGLATATALMELGATTWRPRVVQMVATFDRHGETYWALMERGVDDPTAADMAEAILNGYAPGWRSWPGPQETFAAMVGQVMPLWRSIDATRCPATTRAGFRCKHRSGRGRVGLCFSHID